MIIVYYCVIVTAIALMLVGLVMAIRLRKIASGGTVGKVVNALLALIILFTAGYGLAPWMPCLPKDICLLLVSGIFFFGALFVILVLWLITGLVKKVIKELDL